MTQVFLNLGSNIEPARYLPLGLDELRQRYGELRCSPIYQSAAVGFAGDPFWNMGVELWAELSLADLAAELRDLEFTHGRPENATRFSSRTLDIDILTYGDLVGEHDGIQLPRAELLENAYVLAPMADLVPDLIHPVAGRSYRDLWQDFDKDRQPLTVVG